MPLTWGKQRGRTHDPHLDTSPFAPSPNLCSDPDYASEQAGADDGIRTRDPHLGNVKLAPGQSTCTPLY